MYVKLICKPYAYVFLMYLNLQENNKNVNRKTRVYLFSHIIVAKMTQTKMF